MIIFAAQLHRFHISVTGDRVISLSSYPQYAGEISKATDQGMGKEFVVILIPSENTKEIEEFKSETPEETRERFRKRMNALIGELAQLRKESAERTREVLKKEWIEKGYIQKTTTEFDVMGYAGRIAELLAKIELQKHDNGTSSAE